MILSTIGFGDMIAYPPDSFSDSKNITIWFCSCYIMSGMALTAMCFNILQDEIVHRFAHQSGRTETVNSSVSIDELTSGQLALTS
uniref:Uncharacterized protein n=1 Tax=Bracon brevicornis TaxID=1563983 RepID=A0A6V7JMJ2_9HYME